jgi:hypothetical protein
MRLWMTGADSTLASRMMAKRLLTLAPVISSNRSPPASVKVSATYHPPRPRLDWSGTACASRSMSPVISALLKR